MLRRPAMRVEGWDVRRLARADVPALQALFERSADHFVLHDGGAPGPDAAEIEFDDVPPGRTVDDKHLHAVVDPEDSGRLIAVVESVSGFPDEHTWFLGLLLVDPDHRRRGLGAALLEGFERMAGSAGFDTIRLAVIEPNEAGRRFWERSGFEPAAIHEERPFGALTHRVHVLTKWLPPAVARIALVGPTSAVWRELAPDVEGDLARLARPGVRLVYRLTGVGPESVRTDADVVAAAPGVVATVRELADEGVDAVIVDCTDDPGVADAAAAVPIPVVGAGTALAAAISSAPGPVVRLTGDELRELDGGALDERLTGAASVALAATGFSDVAEAVRRRHPGLVVLDPLPLALDAALARLARDRPAT